MKEKVFGWHDAARIGRQLSALTVAFADGRCLDHSTINDDVIGDFDMLAGQRCDGLDQGRETAGT